VVLCRKCGEFKARSEFHVKASSPSGLNPWCKECQNNYMRGYASTRRRLKRTDPSLEVILNVFELKYGTRDVRKVTLENDLVVLVEQVSKFMPHLTPQAILRKILKEAMPDNDSST
jgi:transposase-like protein